MRRKKCDKNCLECKLPKCVHDIEDQHEYVRDNYDRIRHAEYYKKHKTEIDAKQKEFDSKHRSAESNHDYYIRHKEQIKKMNQERYANNRDVRLQQSKDYYWQHREEISERRKLRRREKQSGEVLQC